MLDGYTLLNARLEADGTEATNLILRYERAGDLTRDVHIAISATGVGLGRHFLCRRDCSNGAAAGCHCLM